jgi:hypothetical protein
VAEGGMREGEVVSSKADNCKVSKNRKKWPQVEASGWLIGGGLPGIKKSFTIFLEFFGG